MKNLTLSKRNFVISAIAIATAGAISCSRDSFYSDRESLVQDPGIETTINAGASLPETEGGDKAYLDGQYVKWEASDQISINGTHLTASYLSNDSKTATFYGTAYGKANGANSVYWAVYPTSLIGNYSNSSLPSNVGTTELTVTWPESQVCDLRNSNLKNYTYMAGYASVPTATTSIQFDMKNLGSVLKLTLKANSSTTSNKQVTKITLSSSGALAGTFTVKNLNSTPSVTASANQKYTQTITFKDASGNSYLDISSEKTVYIMVPPISSKDLTIKIYNQDNQCVTKIKSSLTLARNNIYIVSGTSDLNFDNTTYYFISNSSSNKVAFAPGNLQWSPTGGGNSKTYHKVYISHSQTYYNIDTREECYGTWRFAPKQWRTIGSGNSNISNISFDASHNYTGTYKKWIDLFGWATGGWHSDSDHGNLYYHPWSSSNSAANGTNGEWSQDNKTGFNYYGYGPSTNNVLTLTGGSMGYDWAKTNAINNGSSTDEPLTWRTPTAAEWVYIINTRTTHSYANNQMARYTLAYIDTTSSDGSTYTASHACFGLILFPDNGGAYTISTGSSFGAINKNTKEYTTLSYTDFINWETQGVIFLPAGGHRSATTISQYQDHGHYWSVTHDTVNPDYSRYARYLEFSIDYSVKKNYTDTYHGHNVRPIKDL